VGSPFEDGWLAFRNEEGRLGVGFLVPSVQMPQRGVFYRELILLCQISGRRVPPLAGLTLTPRLPPTDRERPSCRKRHPRGVKIP